MATLKEIYSNFNKFNTSPAESKYIAVRNSNGDFQGYVKYNSKFEHNLGEKLYTFGLISDLHNNDTASSTSTDNDEDMVNAFQYFASKNVDMVCCCGDVFSTANDQNRMSYVKSLIDANLGSVPFYTCSGNHDAGTSTGDTTLLNDTLWTQYMGASKNRVVTRSEDSHIPESDVLIFFGESYNLLDVSGNPYTDADIIWLRNQLETYKNKRVLVFNHLFFPGTCDAQNAYVLTSTFFGKQLTKIASLAFMYKNTIWFNGHSHWTYNEQIGDKKANVYVGNAYASAGLECAPQVHVSSSGSTREVNPDSGDKYHRNDLPNSEGAIVEVYSNCIIHTAISFKEVNDTNNYINQSMPIATYKIPFVSKSVPTWTIQEVQAQSDMVVGNIGSSSTDGQIDTSNSNYASLGVYWDVESGKKHFLSLSRPISGRSSSNAYNGNFGFNPSSADTWKTSDTATTPRLCQLFLHVYDSDKNYLGYISNPKDEAPDNYYFLDMTYFEDITDLIFGKYPNARYLRFRLEKGGNNSTGNSGSISQAQAYSLAQQITLSSCSVSEWNAMNNN